MTAISIPWGRATLALELPAAWSTRHEVVRPDLSDVLDDYAAALDAALDAPTDAPRLESLARPGARVALVVDDPSRWTPVRAALPALLARLRQAGVRDDDITISVGVGRHHAVDDAAMQERVGVEIAARFRCFSPPLDDRSAYADLGTTADGLPVRVFRPVAEADLRVLVGSVLPHLQAGFGGGYKLIFPGTSHRSTLGALHRRGIGRDAPSSTADPLDNPMRRALRAAAERIGPCFSVSHLLGAPGQILRVLAGDPDAVQRSLSSEAQRRFLAPTAAPADVVVAGNHPWPGDPMQSFKVLLQHRAACRPGGVLIGFFHTDPKEMDRSFPLPALRAIAATGAVGSWVLRRGLSAADRVAHALHSPAAFMLHWARELVVDRAVLVYAPPLCDRLGPRLGPVRLFRDQAVLWDAARAASGKADTPFVRIFPEGGLTYVRTSGTAAALADKRPLG